MGQFVGMVERYIKKMRWAITWKEERYLTRDPEDFDTDEVNELIAWCRDKWKDLDESWNEVNGLIDKYNRTQAGKWVSNAEYNDNVADCNAADWFFNEARKLYKRLDRLINTFIDYSDEE